jgi:HSP20 family protein
MARELSPGSFYTRSLRTHPLFSMQKELSRLFDDFAGFENTGNNQVFAFSPRLDIHDTDSELHISAEIPGIEEKDVEVSLKDGNLYISGEKKSTREEKQEQGRKYVERSYGKFERVISLPDNLKEDEVDAVFKNGVLEIRIPKEAPAQPQHRKIEVRPGK